MLPGNATADRFHGSVALQGGDVSDDPADEQHHVPGDLLVGLPARRREDQVE